MIAVDFQEPFFQPLSHTLTYVSECENLHMFKDVLSFFFLDGIYI